jgi:hypothetical protein
VKPSYSRRNALRALVVAPVAVVPLAAQSTNDTELAAAEQRIAAAIETLRKFPLPADAEPAAIFKA